MTFQLISMFVMLSDDRQQDGQVLLMACFRFNKETDFKQKKKTGQFY